jgi:predicted nucleic-acid-binding protein
MDFKEIEEYFTNLKSVISGKIVANQDDVIEEIHILADSSRNTKQICRDVQSVLISKYDINVDYKKISIAQISDNLSIDNNFRLKLKSVKAENNLRTTTVKVDLEMDDRIHNGEATGVKTDRNTLRLSAEAGLRAVESSIGFNNCLLLEDIESRLLAGKEVVTSAVTFVYGGAEVILCGSAFVEHSKPEAVVKATLNAINRSVAKSR